MLRTKGWKYTHWSGDLWALNPKTKTFLAYPKDIPYTKFEHYGIVLFLDKQMDSKIVQMQGGLTVLVIWSSHNVY